MTTPLPYLPANVRCVSLGLLVGLSVTIGACSSSSDNDSNDDSGEGTQNTDSEPAGTTAGTVDDDPSSAPVPDLAVRTAIGDVIVGGTDNLTLYTFANDSDGESTCVDGCAETWPPFTTPVAGEDEDFSTLEREDGTLQWTVRGKPLYFYAGDAAEGDITGEGIGDVWYVARPDSAAVGSTELGDTLIARRTINTGSGDPASRVDVDGRTLYVFDNDEPGQSNCNAGCEESWPPLYADAAPLPAAGYRVIERDDGSRQWAYEDRPLYLYGGDAAPGDTTGHGIGDVWWAAIIE